MCRVAKAHGLRCHGRELAFELFPPVVTNKGEGIRRLIKLHGLKTVIYLGDNVSDTDAFRMLRAQEAYRRCTRSPRSLCTHSQLTKYRASASVRCQSIALAGPQTLAFMAL